MGLSERNGEEFFCILLSCVIIYYFRLSKARQSFFVAVKSVSVGVKIKWIVVVGFGNWKEE